MMTATDALPQALRGDYRLLACKKATDELAALLTDRRRKRITIIPDATQTFGKFRTGHYACLFRQLNAGFLSQTESSRIITQPLNTKLTAQIIEKVVAGIGNRL